MNQEQSSFYDLFTIGDGAEGSFVIGTFILELIFNAILFQVKMFYKRILSKVQECLNEMTTK